MRLSPSPASAGFTRHARSSRDTGHLRRRRYRTDRSLRWRLVFLVAWRTDVLRSNDKRSSPDGRHLRAAWRDRQLVLCQSIAARFILDHDDCRMDFGFPPVSSHADRDGANDLRNFKVRHDDRTIARGWRRGRRTCAWIGGATTITDSASRREHRADFDHGSAAHRAREAAGRPSSRG